jgi:hypothetical protein
MKTLTRFIVFSALGVAGIMLITPAQAARRGSFPVNPGDGSVPLISPP